MLRFIGIAAVVTFVLHLFGRPVDIHSVGIGIAVAAVVSLAWYLWDLFTYEPRYRPPAPGATYRSTAPASVRSSAPTRRRVPTDDELAVMYPNGLSSTQFDALIRLRQAEIAGVVPERHSVIPSDDELALMFPRGLNARQRGVVLDMRMKELADELDSFDIRMLTRDGL